MTSDEFDKMVIKGAVQLMIEKDKKFFAKAYILDMAEEAGLGNVLSHNGNKRVWIEGADWHDELEHFAKLVAAAEREACAMVAESYEPECDTCPSGVSNAIRARGQK